MSPFIVTTKRPKARADASPDFDVSRLAVATLEEGHLQRLMIEHGANGDWALAGARKLIESGGTVGPLPDGTTIQVERVLWSVLASDVGVELRWDPPTQDGDYLHATQREELEAVLGAWNAKHSQA